MIYTLTLHLLIAIIISLSCIAINATTWRGMVFSSLANKVESSLSEMIKHFLPRKYDSFNIACWICQPLFRCPLCMSSFWTLLFWFLFGLIFNPILMILTVCGLNVILVSLIQEIISDE